VGQIVYRGINFVVFFFVFFPYFIYTFVYMPHNLAGKLCQHLLDFIAVRLRHSHHIMHPAGGQIKQKQKSPPSGEPFCLVELRRAAERPSALRRARNKFLRASSLHRTPPFGHTEFESGSI